MSIAPHRLTNRVQVRNLSYDVGDLHRWLDSQGDVAVMTADNRSGQYQPHDREWLKQKVCALFHISAVCDVTLQIFNHMKKQSGY